MTALFQQAARIAREHAVKVLERTAIEKGTIISICSACSAFLSEKPAEGAQGGLSHGYCQECYKLASQEIQ